MTWDATGYGSHAETARRPPRDDVVSRRGIDVRRVRAVLPAAEPERRRRSTSTVRYLRPSGQPPIEHDATRWRRTRARRSPSTTRGRSWRRPTSPRSSPPTAPIIVERAMYIDRARPALRGRATSRRASRARHELVPRRGRDRAVLRSVHPARQPRNAGRRRSRVDYLLSTARRTAKTYTSCRRDGRFTIWVDDEQIPAGSGVKPLDNVAVSSAITSTNGVPIIVERAMWWPGPASSAELLERGAQLAGRDARPARGGRWPRARSAAAERRDLHPDRQHVGATPAGAR